MAGSPKQWILQFAFNTEPIILHRTEHMQSLFCLKLLFAFICLVQSWLQLCGSIFNLACLAVLVDKSLITWWRLCFNVKFRFPTWPLLILAIHLKPFGQCQYMETTHFKKGLPFVLSSRYRARHIFCKAESQHPMSHHSVVKQWITADPLTGDDLSHWTPLANYALVKLEEYNKVWRLYSKPLGSSY